MKWLEALKIYNRGHNGAWCIPKKGTQEYEKVKNIMNEKTNQQSVRIIKKKRNA